MTRSAQWRNPTWSFARWAIRSTERVCTLPHRTLTRGQTCPACKAAT